MREGRRGEPGSVVRSQESVRHECFSTFESSSGGRRNRGDSVGFFFKGDDTFVPRHVRGDLSYSPPPPRARPHLLARPRDARARGRDGGARSSRPRGAPSRAPSVGLSRALPRSPPAPRRKARGGVRSGRPARATGGALGADAAEDAVLGYGLARWERERRRDPVSDARLRELGLCSRESRHSTEVVFVNGLRDERARIYWVDYRGKPTRYKTLAPGERHRQQTFVTHPWTFTTVPDDDASDPERAAAGPRRLVVEGSPVYFPPPPPAAASQSRTTSNAAGPRGVDGDEEDPSESVAVAVVERPAERAWSHESHARFPAFFKDVARAFVLSHARLRRGDDDDDRGAAFASTTKPNRTETEPNRPNRPRRRRRTNRTPPRGPRGRLGGVGRGARRGSRREGGGGRRREAFYREAAFGRRRRTPETTPRRRSGTNPPRTRRRRRRRRASRGGASRGRASRGRASLRLRLLRAGDRPAAAVAPRRRGSAPSWRRVVRLAAPTCAVYVPVEDAVRAAFDAESDEGESRRGRSRDRVNTA